MFPLFVTFFSSRLPIWIFMEKVIDFIIKWGGSKFTHVHKSASKRCLKVLKRSSVGKTNSVIKIGGHWHPWLCYLFEGLRMGGPSDILHFFLQIIPQQILRKKYNANDNVTYRNILKSCGYFDPRTPFFIYNINYSWSICRRVCRLVYRQVSKKNCVFTLFSRFFKLPAYTKPI